LLEKAKGVLHKAQGVLKSVMVEFEIARRPLDRAAESEEKNLETIERDAGDEPWIRPTVPFWIDCLVGTIAGLIEFAISLPVIKYAHLGPAGLAVAFAAALTVAIVWSGHRFGGALRRLVHSHKTSGLVVLLIAVGFAVPLAVALGELRQTGIGNQIELRAMLEGTSVVPIPIDGPGRHWELVLMVFMTLSMFALSAMFHFEAEYAGRRYGTATVERKLVRIHTALDRLIAQIDALTSQYQTVEASVRARFEQLRLIHQKSHSRAEGRRRRREEARRLKEEARRLKEEKNQRRETK
jgi:hypothetical protein